MPGREIEHFQRFSVRRRLQISIKMFCVLEYQDVLLCSRVSRCSLVLVIECNRTCKLVNETLYGVFSDFRRLFLMCERLTATSATIADRGLGFLRCRRRFICRIPFSTSSAVSSTGRRSSSRQWPPATQVCCLANSITFLNFTVTAVTKLL